MSKVSKQFEKCSFTLETKAGQKRVYEMIQGLWTDKEYAEYANAYKNNLSSEVGRMGKWIKVCDMSKYQMSSVVEAVNDHIAWAANNGLQGSIVIVDKVIVKMQMQRSSKDGGKDLIPQYYVSSIEEAEAKARELGY